MNTVYLTVITPYLTFNRTVKDAVDEDIEQLRELIDAATTSCCGSNFTLEGIHGFEGDTKLWIPGELIGKCLFLLTVSKSDEHEDA